MTVTPGQAPRTLVKRARMLHAGDGERTKCTGADECSHGASGGPEMAGQAVCDPEAVSEGERGAAALWRVSYLNNIASLSPLLGCWGRVG